MILLRNDQARLPIGVVNGGTIPREIPFFSFPGSAWERNSGGTPSRARDSAARTAFRDGPPPRGAGFFSFPGSAWECVPGGSASRIRGSADRIALRDRAPQRMKKALSALGVFFLVSALLLATEVTAFAQSMDGLVNQYQKEYEEVKPRPGSSVGTDYKLDQMAMGALYTVRSLSMLHDQNGQIIQNQQALMERYDRMIRQNDEVVRLLRRLVELREGAGIVE